MRKKRNKISGKFTVLEHSLQDSDEWQSLSGNAVRVYLLMRRKFNGKNFNDISLTYSEMKPYMTTATFKKVLEELKGKKIITVIRQGGLFNRCSIFSIKNKWFKQT